MESAKMATLLGLIGASILLFSQIITFCRILEYADVLTICTAILYIIGEGLLLTFFIMMFIYYSRRLSNGNQ